ncbi:MAG: serine/threonine-protein kinase [Polyangiales bacterium]
MSEPQNELQFDPGAVFGAYEIVRKIGEGSFGVVYEALRLPLRKRVALKLLKPAVTLHPETIARFFREAEAAAQIQHPNIVEVFDCGEHEGTPFMAMECLDGEALDHRLKRLKRLTTREAVDTLVPIVSAVAAVHARGIIHRDLKPGNIFIAHGPRGETPKLLDFGIAKVREATVELTRTSSVLGTPLYMSPEQMRESKHVDARSDIWSLGVILFECLAGRRPFTGTSILALIEAVTRAPIPSVREFSPTVPEELDALLLRMLERDLDRRIGDARELGAALLPHASERVRLDFAEEFGALTPTVVDTQPRASQDPAPAATGGTLNLSAKAVTVEVEAPPRRGVSLVAIASVSALVSALAVGVSVWQSRQHAGPAVAAHVTAPPPPVSAPPPDATAPPPPDVAAPADAQSPDAATLDADDASARDASIDARDASSRDAASRDAPRARPDAPRAPRAVPAR